MLSREIAGINGIDIETEIKPSVGVALVIVGIDASRNGENITSPSLWTIIEKNTKPETEKFAGQISFPGETKKTNESLNDTIVGAVAGEFSGDDRKINNLWYIEGHSFIKGKVLISGRPAHLVVLAYTDPFDIPNVPLAVNEVTPHGWMTIEELLNEREEKVRKFARETASLERSERFIGRVVSQFSHFPLSRVPFAALLPDGFSSMREFYQKRERKKDISVYGVPIKNSCFG